MDSIHFFRNMNKQLFAVTLIALIVSFVACYNPEDFDDVEFNPTNYEKYLQLSTDIDSIAADGSATVAIMAVISKRSKPEFREIELTTTKGVFIPQGTKIIKVKADEYFGSDTERIVAKATLRSEASATNATVTAKVKYLEQSEVVKFYRVPPTSITVESKAFFITQSLASADTVSATLKRPGGIPTAGHPVDFLVINSLGDTVVNTIKETGYYREHARNSNDKGASSFIFSLGENYLGKLKIIAYTKAGEQVLADSTFIEVIN
jgi:hypothetical protein